MWMDRAAFFALLLVASAATVNYVYDDAGRLVLVDYGNGKTIVYTYDKAGNLLKRLVTAPTGASSGQKKVPEQKNHKPEKR